jgi:hypothetical protein
MAALCWGTSVCRGSSSRWIAGALGAVVVAVGAADLAAAHTLSPARAKAAARAAAARLARQAPGETHVNYSRVRCVRRSAHAFVCSTTVGGATLCAPSETACDGPAPFSIPYAITVRYRDARSTRLRVLVRQA